MNAVPTSSFVRKRGLRVAAGAASAGLLAGLSLVGATSASAATDADCTDSNTVDGASQTAVDIQTLLSDPSAPLICLIGAFNVSTTLIATHAVVLHGLSGAELDGGGATQIFISAYPVTAENIEFTGGNAGFEGGAIQAPTVTVTNSDFHDNTAYLGGAIYGNDVTVSDSTFEHNPAAYGGAITSQDTLSVTASTFTDNSSQFEGGALASYGYAVVDASTFTTNVSDLGGAVWARYQGDGTPTQDSLAVSNSTFFGNEANSEGGAIFTDTATIVQSTFLENLGLNDEAELDAAGQAIYKTSAGDTNVGGNIFAGDDAEVQLSSGVASGAIVDLGGNLFTTAAESDLTQLKPSTGFGTTTALLFNGNTLADNGGPTQTVALYAASPAVDFVPAAISFVTVDQRGVARTAKSDAGAFEFGAPVLAATGVNDGGMLASAAALLLLMGGLVAGFGRRFGRR